MNDLRSRLAALPGAGTAPQVVPAEDPVLYRPGLLNLVDLACERERDKESPRNYLGMSQIGKEPRTLWLEFRWSLPEEVSPRTCRIFELGHVIEDVLIDLLRRISKADLAKLLGEVPPQGADAHRPALQVHTRGPDGKQFRFTDLGGHFSGGMDGAIQGLPESKKWHVLECKSANKDQFAKIQKTGIKTAKPEYYDQVQAYMEKAGLDRALVLVYCKDNSELYAERIKREPFYFAGLREKARQIIEAEEPPASAYPNAQHYEVKNFRSEQWQRVYWGKELPAVVHCRNCRHAWPDTEAQGAVWRCNRHGVSLSERDQHRGCRFHNFIPAMVPLTRESQDVDRVIYRTQDGRQIVNCAALPDHKKPGHYSSQDLIAMSRADFAPEIESDPAFQALRAVFDASILTAYPLPALREHAKDNPNLIPVIEAMEAQASA